MNYINKEKRVQVLYFPRNGYIPDETPRLTARDTVGGESVELIVGSCEVRGHLLRMVVEIPDALHAGEWQWSLVFGQGATVCSATGVLQVTDGELPGVQYNREITYKQYGE